MRAWRTPAIVMTALAGSELGHLAVYQVRYGARAGAVQSQGVHAYFPGLAGSVGFMASATVILSLVVIAAARMLHRRRSGLPVVSRPAYFHLFSLLSLMQLTIFCVQENVEAWLAGSSALPLLTPLLLGSFALLPIAAILAAVLVCLLVEVERAVVVLATGCRAEGLLVWHPAVPWRCPRRLDVVLAHQTGRRSSAPRAPPSPVARLT